MEYLLLAIAIIIVYTEIFPTLSIFFEYIRTLIAAKITIIQQQTIHIQEDIERTQAEMEPCQTHAIGFRDRDEEYMEEEYDE